MIFHFVNQCDFGHKGDFEQFFNARNIIFVQRISVFVFVFVVVVVKFCLQFIFMFMLMDITFVLLK